ncbi:MAG: UpxY family transcription antiterminator [Tannerellaceae bacterium]|jgi:transcription antitermination factor NusG|nr:UpxY family transcription antiterminator [Tannerellaceae bacterium]
MTTKLNILNWYVLYTSPRAEKQVKGRIAAQEIEVWLPLHRAPRVWSDRVKIIEIPLFNSYIFVKCKEYELRDLLKIYGVSRIVYYDGKPAVIRQREIDAIKGFLEQAANHTLLVGDEVKILSGSMKNISGKVKKIKKKYLFIYLEQMGVTAKVDLSEIIPVKYLK